MRARGGAGGARRLAVSPSARSSEADLHGPTTRTRLTATGTRRIPTDIRRTATVIRRITAIAIRRTTATETGLITATTAHVTDERLPGRAEGARETKPRAVLFCASSPRGL